MHSDLLIRQPHRQAPRYLFTILKRQRTALFPHGPSAINRSADNLRKEDQPQEDGNTSGKILLPRKARLPSPIVIKGSLLEQCWQLWTTRQTAAEHSGCRGGASKLNDPASAEPFGDSGRFQLALPTLVDRLIADHLQNHDVGVASAGGYGCADRPTGRAKDIARSLEVLKADAGTAPDIDSLTVGLRSGQ
jgi:hypothetical protein